MRVCHITTVHKQNDTRIFQKQCKTLANNSYSVYLVVQGVKDEIIEGVQIISLKKPKNRLDRMIFTAYSAYRRSKHINADIYHFHDPELIIVGLLLAFNKKRVIYDVHEDYPQTLLSSDRKHLPEFLKQFVSMLVRIVEATICHWFSACVTATPTITARFLQYNARTITINNYVMPHIFKRTTPYRERKHNIAYVGSISLARGIVQMIQANDAVNEQLNTQIQLIGEIPATLRNIIENTDGWKKTHEHGHLNQEHISKILDLCRIGLVVIHPEPRYMVAQPTKLYEYMSAGIPVIASDFPLWREIIERHQCGLLVDPLNPQAIADAITWLLEHPVEAEAMGQRGRRAVETEYNWAIEARKLLNLYDELAAQRRT